MSEAGNRVRRSDTPPGEDVLYDRYLDECLGGDGPTPAAFLARYPDASDELRRRLEAVAALRATGGREPGPEAPLPFERLGGYRIKRRLGIGGMGSVYLAEQESLGRTVALKVIRSELRGSDTMLQRFEREARAVARLRHPNIVNVHEFGRDSGAHFIAMELVRGRPLDEVLRDEPPPMKQVVRWCAEIARALAYAHEQGIVHRDVKPQNIMITPEGRPVLLDFGVASLAESEYTRLTTQFAGSPQYAAPEQLRQGFDPVDGRADVYALGVTLYEALTGSTPFGGGRLEEVLLRIVREEPARMRALNPALGADIETVVLKAMEKDPARRYATGWELADDLQRVLEIRPIHARPPSLLHRVRKWTRRHPVAATIVGSVVAVLAITAVVLWRNAAADRAEAGALVAEARRLVERYRVERLAHFKREADFERADRQRAAAYWSAAQDTRFEQLLDEIERHRRMREEVFYEVLDLLSRAERQHADVEGVPEVRALMLNERAEAARTARDPAVERYLRRKVLEDDPGGRGTTDRRAHSRMLMQTDPPGAAVYLFRFEEQRQLFPAGDRRLVPVPVTPAGVAPPAPLMAGRWALRVVRGAGGLRAGDLILEIAGEPIRERVFADRDGAPVRRGDRLLAVDGDPVRNLWRVENARLEQARVYTFRRERSVVEVPAAKLDVGFADARTLAEQGGLPARVWSDGAERDVRLPAGLAVRPTAAPRFLSPACRAGTTPITEPLLVGSYAAVVRLAGFEDLVLPFTLTLRHEARFDLKLLPEGTTPPGFVFIAGSTRTRAADDPTGLRHDFWIQERAVTRDEYLAFVNARDTWRDIGAGVPRERYIQGLHPYFARQVHSPYPIYEPDGAGGFKHIEPHTAGLPVIWLSWDAAQAYARWKSREDGRTYALPLESEWGRAAGDAFRTWPFGNAFRHKWVSCNLSRPGKTEYAPAFRYPIDESPSGVYDTAGNTSEWLDKWWDIDNQERRHYTGGSAAHGDPRMFKIGGGNGHFPHASLAWVGCRLVFRR